MFSAISLELRMYQDSKYLFSVIANEKHNHVLGIIADMTDSLTINISYYANDLSAVMSLHEDVGKYKMFISLVIQDYLLRLHFG